MNDTTRYLDPTDGEPGIGPPDDIPGADPSEGRCASCDGEGRIPAYGCGDQAGGWADTCQDCKGTGRSPDPAPGYCAACHDPIPVLGPLVCWCCLRRGYCPTCGLLHGGAQMCPAVAAVLAEQEVIEKAAKSKAVADAALAILDTYEAFPIWQEAA